MSLNRLSQNWGPVQYVLDLYVSVFIVIGLVFYLGLIRTAAPEAVTVCESMIVLFSVNFAANSFGLDGAPGVDRYGLFPISGEHIMRVKNAAFLTIVSALLLVVMPFAAWRLGPVIASIIFMQAIAGAILCMCWGNLTSLRRPATLTIYKFSSGGTLADACINMLLLGVPSTCSVYLLHYKQTEQIAASVMLAIAISALVVHVTSIGKIGTEFERNREELRERL